MLDLAGNEKRLIDLNLAIERAKESDKIVGSSIWETCEVVDFLEDCPIEDVVEVADMKEFAEDVVYQFGYYCQNGGRLHITHGGLSTLEWAFYILGWENPHPVPECECEIEGCHEHATCDTPTADGYKRVCGKHFRNFNAKMDGDGNEIDE